MHRLRPRLAIGTCIAVWALSAFLVIDAVIAIGLPAVLPFAMPVVLFSALVWLILWNPCVAIDRENKQIIVKNVLATFECPAASIQDIVVGPMVKFHLIDESGKPVVVTAWNAPGLSKEKSLARTPSAASLSTSTPDRAHEVVNVWKDWGGYALDERTDIPEEDRRARKSVNTVALGTVALIVLVTVLSLVWVPTS